MKLYISNTTDPFQNLALEEVLLINATERTMFIWVNKKAIVVGRNQNTYQEINTKFVHENDVKVVRRQSGGGTVYHDEGNFLFSFIYPNTKPTKIDFKKMLQPMLTFLNDKYQLNAEFSGRNDILVDTKKVSGTAVYLKNNNVLIHGTLLFDSKLDNLVKSLTVDDEKLISKGIKSVRSRVTNIKEHLIDVDFEAFKKEMSNYFINKENATLSEFTKEEIAQAKELTDNKYSTNQWVYGRNHEFEFKNKKKFDDGILEVNIDLSIKNNVIEEIKFYSDIMSLGSLNNISKELVNLEYSIPVIKNKLNSLDLEKYFKNISVEELIDLLFNNAK